MILLKKRYLNTPDAIMPLFNNRHLFRIICLILSLYIMGIELGVFACWRKMINEELFCSGHQGSCKLMNELNERQKLFTETTKYEESVSNFKFILHIYLSLI
jgi:hypothetical protein